MTTTILTTAQQIIRLEATLRQSLDNKDYRAVKNIAGTLYENYEYINWDVADFLYRHGVILQDVENAQFSDWVYFTEEYDAGNVIVPEGMGGRICTDRAPDEMPVSSDCHDVQIDLNGKYYEIEVPYNVLAMQ